MRNRLCAVASAVVLAATFASPAWSNWGCGYKRGDIGGFVADANSRADAEEAALRLCKRNGPGTCRIVGCKEGINNEADARAEGWISGTIRKPCGNAGQPKC
jgi:hypothetical protein